MLDLVNYAADGSVNSRFDYTYDTLGLRTTESTLDGTWTYNYDAIGELTHAVFASTNPAIANQDLTYNYDAVGNRTSTVINGVTTAYTVNKLNEYTRVGTTIYGYDADGNQTSVIDARGTTTYTYDADGHLIGESGPGGVSAFQYNSLGNLVSRTSNELRTTYLIDPEGLGNVVGEYRSGTGAGSSYVYGIGLTAVQTVSGNWLHYDFDASGSTSGITTGAGAYANSYDYLPFGGVFHQTQAVENPFTFGGQYGDMSPDADHVVTRARAYSPSTGRFNSPDPLGIDGSVQSYEYSYNNPISYTDPSGYEGYDTGDVPETASVNEKLVGNAGLLNKENADYFEVIENLQKYSEVKEACERDPG